MTTTKTAAVWACTALLGLGLIMGCASNPVQSELEHAKALVSAGRLKEGVDRLQVISRANPGNAAARDAYNQALDRYSALLQAQAAEATAAKRYDEAENLYKQLASLPGQSSRAQAGLEALAAARAAAPAPVAVPPVAATSGPAVVTVPAATATQALPVQPRTVAPQTALAPAEQKAAPRNAASTRRTPAPKATPVAAAPAPVVPTETPDVKDGLQRRISMQFKDAPVRSLFDIISKTSGLNVLIDKDVSPDLRTSIFLKNTTVEAAIKKILMTTQLAQRVLDENTLLIYNDDPLKQHEHQELQIKAFYLGNADPKAVVNSLKVMIRAKDLVIDEKLNMIIMRDTADAIRMAEKVVALHDAPEPEVMLEVSILQVSGERLRKLGVDWNNPLVSLSPLGEKLESLFNLSGSTVKAAGVGAAINAESKDDDVKLLANPRIRAKNREKAKILIGDRLPNITTTTNAAATGSSVLAQTVNYIEVGLKLDFEPTVFADGQVVIKVGLEVSSAGPAVTTGSGTSAFPISTRTANTVLRLKDGENQILGGLIRDDESKSFRRIPGFGDIPLLGKLFGGDNDLSKKTEVILSITPRLIRGIQRPAADVSNFSIGTDSSLRGRRPDGGAGEVIQTQTDSGSVPRRGDDGSDASERRNNNRQRDEED